MSSMVCPGDLQRKERPKKGFRGAFFCYALPALDKETGEFSEEAGTTRWYLYDAEHEAILEEPPEIVESIRSTPETPRVLAGQRVQTSSPYATRSRNTLRTRTSSAWMLPSESARASGAGWS